MKKIRTFIASHGRQYGLVVAAEIITAGLLGIKLDALPRSLGPTEQIWSIASSNIHVILSHPTDLPYKLLLLLAHQFGDPSSLVDARLPSVLLGMVAIGLFIYILHRWYGNRSTVIGFFLLATSAWFLHVGRFSGPGIEYIAAMVALIALHIALHDHEENTPMLFLWLGALWLVITIPGIVWLVAVSLAWQWRAVVRAWLHVKRVWVRIVWTSLAGCSIAAIAGYMVYAPTVLLPWLGLPAHIPTWHVLLQNLANVLKAFSYEGPQSAGLWLGRLPLVDIFTLAMFAAGAAFYIRHWQAGRTQLLGSYLLVAIGVASLVGATSLGLILPLVYLVAAAGIAYILQFWLKTFPRNPLARAFGILCVCVVVGLSCSYNGLQYFVAWPHNPDTAAVYPPSGQ